MLRLSAYFGSPKSKTLQFDALQLNTSLYELYSPSSTPAMEVLFFHGFQHENYADAHLLTWRCKDGSSLWPQTWLAEEFSLARILTVAYNAEVMKSCERENYDLYNMSENLISDLLDAKIGQNRPVILVGHSFGGLVIKAICVCASSEKGGRSDELNSFLENLKGIFFYSTPHQGIKGNIAKHFVKEGPLLELVKILDTDAARDRNKFDKLCGQGGPYKNWQIAGVGESRPTKWGRFNGFVVEEASSRCGYVFNIVEGADHISVCRPMSKNCRSFYALTNFLHKICSHSKIMTWPKRKAKFVRHAIDLFLFTEWVVLISVIGGAILHHFFNTYVEELWLVSIAVLIAALMMWARPVEVLTSRSVYALTNFLHQIYSHLKIMTGPEREEKLIRLVIELFLFTELVVLLSVIGGAILDNFFNTHVEGQLLVSIAILMATLMMWASPVELKKKLIVIMVTFLCALLVVTHILRFVSMACYDLIESTLAGIWRHTLAAIWRHTLAGRIWLHRPTGAFYTTEDGEDVVLGPSSSQTPLKENIHYRRRTHGAVDIEN